MRPRHNARESHAAKIWGIRAGRGGEAHDLFLGEGVIALADAGIGDLMKLERSREAFYGAYRRLHPTDTKVGSAGIGGKFFRFAHEVRVGDLAVYPASRDKNVYVGTVLSKYFFDVKSSFPHRRIVRWKFIIPTSEFSSASRYELGAARTFFEFKNHAEEFLLKTAEKSVPRFRSKANA
jgi:restriction system protein